MSDGSQLQIDPRDPMLGTVIDARFRIDAVLGRGGMGSVYRAQHLQLDKAVALKLMNGSLWLDRKLAERFSREVKVCSALLHPNIVKVHSSGVSTQGQPYVAMDYVQGETLSQRLSREGHMNQAIALPLLLQIARGLACAHDRGIAHRDVKPSNVMLSVGADGTSRALIVDFGLSKFIPTAGAHIGQSQTATTMQGSPSYMSPEHCQNLKTDFRTDVYSFGCLMYEVLSGRLPFEGDSAFALMYEHVHSPVPPFDSQLAISNGVESIVRRCLEKQPEDRYATAGDVVSALEGVVNGPESIAKSASNNKTGKVRLRRTVSPAIYIGSVIALCPFLLLLMFCGVPSTIPNESCAEVVAEILSKVGLFDLQGEVLKSVAATKLRDGDDEAFARHTLRSIKAAAKSDSDAARQFATDGFLALRTIKPPSDTKNLAAVEKYSRILEISAAALVSIPNISNSHDRSLGVQAWQLGQMLSFAERLALAETVLTRSVSILERDNPHNWSDLSFAYFSLANTHRAQACAEANPDAKRIHLEQALLYYQRTLICRERDEAAPEALASLHSELAAILRMLGRHKEAVIEEAAANKEINLVRADEKPESISYYWLQRLHAVTLEGNKALIHEAILQHELAQKAEAAALAARKRGQVTGGGSSNFDRRY